MIENLRFSINHIRISYWWSMSIQTIWSRNILFIGKNMWSSYELCVYQISFLRKVVHNGRDQKPHIFKHSSEKCHKHFYTNNFKIVDNEFKNNSFNLKVWEALLIKQIKPSLMKLNWGQYRQIVQLVVTSNEKAINRQIVIRFELMNG